MISTARLLKEQSPSPQENKGWLELPNGQRFQPKQKRRWFAGLMGIAA